MFNLTGLLGRPDWFTPAVALALTVFGVISFGLALWATFHWIYVVSSADEEGNIETRRRAIAKQIESIPRSRRPLTTSGALQSP